MDLAFVDSQGFADFADTQEFDLRNRLRHRRTFGTGDALRKSVRESCRVPGTAIIRSGSTAVKQKKHEDSGVT